MNITTCRSCGASLFWATTERGKKMPVDAVPNPSGNVAVREINGSVFATVDDNRQGSLWGRYTSHFATCPDANTWRSA